MFGFGFFSIMFPIVFCLVIGVFVYVFVKGISEWNRNNNSPRLTVPARVTSKQTRVSHNNTGNMHHHHTHYYATFEVESGDRMEFSLSSSEYGMLAEGDFGHLSFQGTRFLGFERV